MGDRGPKPTPTAVRELRGDRKGRMPKNEPQLSAGPSAPPVKLSASAQAEWDRVYPILERTRIYSEADGAALAIYCETFAEWTEGTARLAKEGPTVMTAAGNPKPNPLIAVVRQARADCVRMLAEFGMTPSSRSKIAALPEPEKDELAEFMAD